MSDDRLVLKERLAEALDRNRDRLVAFGQDVFGHAELGFRKERTATLVADHLRRLQLEPEEGLALTGVKARLQGARPGPTVCVMGELDGLPVLHPSHGGCLGTNHAADFQIADAETAYIRPATALAWTIVDLLADEAAEARRVLAAVQPRLSRDAYLAHMRGLARTERYP